MGKIRDKITLIRYNKVSAGVIPVLIRNKVTRDPKLPYLISFPRTGSHWLRVLIEYHSNRPLLTRSFLDHDNTNFILNHSHDMDLTIRRDCVVYLYRNPTDTIFSQLEYHRHDIRDATKVAFWTNQYAHHLLHWLHLENITKKKMCLSYEELKSNTYMTFQRVCEFLDLDMDESNLHNSVNAVTAAYVKELTQHDKQAISRNTKKDEDKAWFIDNMHPIIRNEFRQVEHQCFGAKKIIDWY